MDKIFINHCIKALTKRYTYKRRKRTSHYLNVFNVFSGFYIILLKAAFSKVKRQLHIHLSCKKFDFV